MLKVTKHTVRCDLVRGFNHLARSGLARGLLNNSTELSPCQRIYKIAVKLTLLRDFEITTTMVRK